MDLADTYGSAKLNTEKLLADASLYQDSVSVTSYTSGESSADVLTRKTTSYIAKRSGAMVQIDRVTYSITEKEKPKTILSEVSVTFRSVIII